MDSRELAGQTMTFGSAATASCSAGIATILEREETIVLLIGAGGLICSVIGLIIMAWNGQRNYRIQRGLLELAKRGQDGGSES